MLYNYDQVVSFSYKVYVEVLGESVHRKLEGVIYVLTCSEGG